MGSKPETMVCIDAAKEDIGWAEFRKGVLFDAGVIVFPQELHDVHDVGLWLATQLRKKVTTPPRVFVGENMMHRGARERASFNENILPIAAVMRTCVGAVCEADYTDVSTPDTSWKGQADKQTFLRSIIRRLDREGERALLIELEESGEVEAKFLHEAITAAGLGLWYLGRR